MVDEDEGISVLVSLEELEGRAHILTVGTEVIVKLEISLRLRHERKASHGQG